ncbi:hypothetical protein J422_05090 [Methanocaldococcus villosus KIN24-T80]|uniref:Probable membrane transporter protein n=1 Tax=Methanocaldococcus villosus KIN24-T80 TaxID=1069083 RepID=N6VQ26_9EURY|nr:sulfite exporter TauE/SafE family protein [Methanocaldococcus villosus]ENN95990.1 hypothetical protein J422_05090 [Methanocaldococcus villosus KIN24-T80]
MNILFFITLIILGFFVGILGSLLGVSGGFIITPILTLIFESLSIPEAMKFAVGTSLFVVFINSIFALLRHRVNIRCGLYIGILGSLIAFIFGKLSILYIPSSVVKKIFGIFLIIISGYYLLLKDFYDDREVRFSHLVICGLISGILAGLFGIGGGIAIIPILSMFKYDPKKLVTVSISAIPIISFGGLISYLSANVDNYIYNIGYVSIPIAIIIAFPIAFSSKLGHKLFHKLDNNKIKILLSTILFIIGLVMLIK